MGKKGALISLIVAGTLFLSAACSGEREQKKSNGESLVMYALDSGGFFRDTAVKYSDKRGKKDIRVESFSAGQYEEYANRQASELMAGMGPDIITFQYYNGTDRMGLLNSFLKYVPQGLLYDLNQLMAKDGDFKLPEYNAGALESGVFNGKRYFVPLSCNVEVFFTTEEKLEENHIGIDADDWNWEALLKQAEEYRKRSGRSSFFNWRDYLAGLIGNWGASFIDLGSGSSSFASGEFEALLKTYGGLRQAVVAGNQDDNSVMSMEDVYGFSMLSYKIQRSKGGLKAYSVPSGKGGMGGAARPNLVVALNQNCSDIKAAYDYVKYLLSEEAQLMIANIPLAGFPVNRKAYEQTKERFLEEQATFGELRELTAQVDKIVSGAGRYEILDEAISGIVQASAADFLSGAQSAARVGELIDEGMKKYFQNITAPVYAGKAGNGKSGEKSNAGGQKEKTLKIYYVEAVSEDNVKHVINTYKESHDNVGIEETAFSSEDNLKERLTTDLLTGEGPDIILFKPYTFNSLHKVMDNGIFADLGGLIEADGEFNLSDYYEKVLDYGVYKGKRYFMPVDFWLPVLYTTEGTLKKNGVEIDESQWTWDELAKISGEFMKRNEGKDKFMFLGLMTDLTNAGIPLVDYDKKSSNFSTPGFIKYFEALTDASKGAMPAEKYNALKFDDLWFEVFNGTCVMICSEAMGNLRNVVFANSWTNHYLDEDIKILPLPSVNGDGKVYASPNQCVAINEKCKYKEDAFDMIKLFLSLENQACLSFTNSYMNGFNWPVNKKAFASMKEYFKNSEEVKYKPVRQGKLITCPVEDEVAGQLDRILEKLETGYLVDYEIMRIAGEEMALHMEGKKALEEALEAVDNKVKLYLSE